MPLQEGGMYQTSEKNMVLLGKSPLQADYVFLCFSRELAEILQLSLQEEASNAEVDAYVEKITKEKVIVWVTTDETMSSGRWHAESWTCLWGQTAWWKSSSPDLMEKWKLNPDKNHDEKKTTLLQDN